MRNVGRAATCTSANLADVFPITRRIQREGDGEVSSYLALEPVHAMSGPQHWNQSWIEIWTTVVPVVGEERLVLGT